MICKNCGAQCTGKFCEHCGAKLTDDPMWQAPFSSQPQPQSQPQSQPQPQPQPPETPINASLYQKESGGFAKKLCIPIAAVVLIAVVAVAVTRLRAKPVSAIQPQSQSQSEVVTQAQMATDAATQPQSQNAAVTQPKTQSQSTAASKTSKATTSKAEGPYTVELSSGNFTSGIDFPAGTYDIEAVRGTGNVFSDNMLSGGVNLIMSSSAQTGSQKTFKNAKFPQGVVVTVGNVTVKITSAKADIGAMTKRTNTATKTVQLTPGNYTAGTDFEAGVYDIKAVSGAGNVYSSNVYKGGINAIMSVNSNILYQKEYRNVVLTKGVTLTVTSVTVELTPSK